MFKITLRTLPVYLLLIFATFVTGTTVSVSSAFIPRGSDVGAPILGGESAPLAPDLGHDRANQSQDETYLERILQSQWEKYLQLKKISKFRRKTLQIGRISKLVLLSAIATAAAPWPEKFRQVAQNFATLGTLLIVPIEKMILNDSQVGWAVMACTASAAIEAEVIKFRAKVGHYSTEDPYEATSTLRERCSWFASSVDDPMFRTTLPDSAPVPGVLATRDEYIERRVDTSIMEFTRKAESNEWRSKVCRNAEYCFYILAGRAPLLAQMYSVAPLPVWLRGIIGGGTGAFIMIAGAFASHRDIHRFREVADDYFRAVDHLKEIRENWPLAAKEAGSQGWDNQVTKSESIIETAYTEWANIKKTTAAKPRNVPVWKDDVVCGTDESGRYPAVDRKNWLIEHQNMTEEEAKQKVMDEFPEHFY